MMVIWVGGRGGVGVGVGMGRGGGVWESVTAQW
jgi:hypothetical protein